MVFIAPMNYLFVIIASIVLFKEKLSGRQWGGVLVITAGIIIFNLNYL